MKSIRKNLDAGMNASAEQEPENAGVIPKPPMKVREPEKVSRIDGSIGRDYSIAKTFPKVPEIEALMEASIGGGQKGTKYMHLLAMGCAMAIYLQHKTGSIPSRTVTEGFFGVDTQDLVTLFGEEEAKVCENNFEWARQNATR